MNVEPHSAPKSKNPGGSNDANFDDDDILRISNSVASYLVIDHEGAARAIYRLWWMEDAQQSRTSSIAHHEQHHLP